MLFRLTAYAEQRIAQLKAQGKRPIATKGLMAFNLENITQDDMAILYADGKSALVEKAPVKKKKKTDDVLHKEA